MKSRPSQGSIPSPMNKKLNSKTSKNSNLQGTGKKSQISFEDPLGALVNTLER